MFPGDEMPIRVIVVRYRGIAKNGVQAFFDASRSPTYSLPAGYSRPDDEAGRKPSPRKVVTLQVFPDQRRKPGTAINPLRKSDVCSEVP